VVAVAVGVAVAVVLAVGVGVVVAVGVVVGVGVVVAVGVAVAVILAVVVGGGTMIRKNWDLLGATTRASAWSKSKSAGWDSSRSGNRDLCWGWLTSTGGFTFYRHHSWSGTTSRSRSWSRCRWTENWPWYDRGLQSWSWNGRTPRWLKTELRKRYVKSV